MSSTNSSEEVSRRSEEGRVLVGLGLLAVAVAYRDHLPEDFAFPIPYPFPHLQVYTIPIFDLSVFFYSLYAICMGFYFSGDAKWFGHSFAVRKGFQRIGHGIAVGYMFLLFWYLMSLLGWLLVPADLALTYVIVWYLSFFYIVSLISDITAGRWGRTNHQIARRVKNVYAVYKTGLVIVMKKLWRKYRDRLPLKLREVRRKKEASK